MIRKSGYRFSLGTNAKRLPGDDDDSKKNSNPSGCTLQPVPNLLHQASAPASSCPYRIVVTGFGLHGWRHRVCFYKLRRHPELGWTDGWLSFKHIARDEWALILPGHRGCQIGLWRNRY